MPRIIPYEQQVMPQGTVGGQATPNDFGAQVGAGMQQMGAGLGQMGDQIQRVEEDKGRLWAYNAASQAHADLKQNLDQRVNALDPNAPDFTEKAGQLTQDFQQHMEDQTSTLMDSAPSRSARRVLASHMAINGRALLNTAISEQARVTGECTGKLIADGIKADQDAVAADPSNENYVRILENRSNDIGGLNNLDPVAKLKWLDQMSHQLAVTQVQVLAATNPQLFLATVHAQGGQTSTGRGAVPGGTPADPEATSTDLPQVQPLTEQEIGAAAPAIAGWGKLTWQEKVAAVRQAEGVLGGALASERGSMLKDLKDAETSLMAGKNYPGLDDPRFGQGNLLKLFGPVEGQRKFDQLTYVKQLGGLITQMASMPVQQAVATFKTLEPQGGPEFADKAPAYHQAVDAFQRLQELRNKDYMTWAQSAGVGNVKPVDFSTPDAFRRTVNDRVPAATSGALDYRADAHLLTKDEAGQFSDLMTRLTPSDQVSYLRALRQATDDRWFRDTMAVIAPRNTTLAYAASVSEAPGTVTTAAGPQNGETVAKHILEGAHILQGKDLDDPQHTGRPLALNDGKLREYFWEVVGPDAFASPDAQRSNQLASDTFQAVKNYLAADFYHRGFKPDDLQDKRKGKELVQNAVDAVTGGVIVWGSQTISFGGAPEETRTGDHLFLPWGMTKDEFKARFHTALDVTLRDSGLKGTAMDVPGRFHYQNMGDGRYLITNGNKPLMGKDGRTVIVDVNQPAPLSTIKDL